MRPLNKLFSILLLVLGVITYAQNAEVAINNGYTILKILDVGKAPHQIEFSRVENHAYIAAAGSDKISLVDSKKLCLKKQFTVQQVPLGVKEIQSNNSLIVTQFRSNALVNIDAKTGKAISTPLVTGGGPSMLYGPLKNGRFLVPIEKANKVWLVNGNPFSLIRSYDVGKRPFPPAATEDGRLAFVPNYDDGTVTVIDLLNETIVTTIAVGEHPSGGVMLSGSHEYAVAVRGENTIKFINTSSFKITAEIKVGIGESPFSVIVAPDGQRAYVNNTVSDDVSVIDLSQKKVITRIPVGKKPIVIEVSPDGKTLWVACEGSHDLYIFSIPKEKRE